MTDIDPSEAALAEFFEKHDLNIEATFVPFSKSRSATPHPKSGDLNLNWRVSLFKGGRLVIATDYSKGIGHIPGYKFSPKITVDAFNALIRACESGMYNNLGMTRLPEPTLEEVLYSLSMDADAINARDFEDWASHFGYDPDSRKAEKVYLACLNTAMKLQHALGADALDTLRDLYQDY